MPLIKAGKPVDDDPWTFVDDAAPLPEAGPVVVSLARWRAEREALIARGEPLGLRLASHERAAEIADDVGRLVLIALEFPKFRDGRAYTTARQLRERYRFGGELRAVGQVLRDQFLFMHRCGIDAFAVADERAVSAFAAALQEISVVYQAAGDDSIPVAMLRRLRRAAQ